MGFRYSKRIRLSKNVFLNLSKSGITPSLRTKAGSISSKGFSVRTGIPGLSYRSTSENKGCLLTLTFWMALAVFSMSFVLKGQRIFQNSDQIRSKLVHLKYESDSFASFIEYEAFVVNFDTIHKVPAFVIHRLSFEQITEHAGAKAERSNRFWSDPKLGIHSAQSTDYYKSGYDRGHHAPAGDFSNLQQMMDETFVFTNISPQNPMLNRGVLAQLETSIRAQVLACTCEAYIVTGTLFFDENENSIGEDSVGVPAEIYKLIYYPTINWMDAFCFPNDLQDYSSGISAFQCTVDDVEQKTGQDFFDLVPEEIQLKLEKSKRKI